MRAAEQERAGEAFPSPGADPALFTPPSETTRASAMQFWRRVNRGQVILSPASDQLITHLRARSWNWVDVAAAVRAAHIREKRGSIYARYVERKRALRWREQYRKSKEAPR